MHNIKIKITKQAGRLYLATPYNPDLPAEAKKIGGRWDAGSKEWHFDPRDEDAVRDLCRGIYGTDGSDPRKVTVQVKLAPFSAHGRSVYVLGCPVASVYGRDGGAKFPEGVVLVAGSIGSAGSRKNPRIVSDNGAVLELRDVARDAVERVLTGEIEAGDCVVGIKAVEAKIDHDALLAERDRLTARIAEIDAMLAGPKTRAIRTGPVGASASP